jgi:DNA repair exonuclease SbcCD ATPase subunit
MERSLKVCTFLLTLFLIACLTPLRLAHAQAAFYKYVDKNGTIHFTDRLDSIPEEYRNQIKVYKGAEKRKPALSKEQGVTEEQNRRLRKAEEKKEEEEKALQERAAREEKLKERQEIQDRIASLEEQVSAKEEEQAGLRNSGMVNDRIRLNQLNAEISALVREIRSLQRELSDK